MGYSFDIEDNNSSKNSPQIPAIFIEKIKIVIQNYLIEAFGTTLNLPMCKKTHIQVVFLIFPDESGSYKKCSLVDFFIMILCIHLWLWKL